MLIRVGVQMDGVAYMMVVSLFVASIDEWRSNLRLYFLKRLICYGHARSTSFSPLEYDTLKPLMVLWALVDRLQVRGNVL